MNEDTMENKNYLNHKCNISIFNTFNSFKCKVFHDKKEIIAIINSGWDITIVDKNIFPNYNNKITKTTEVVKIVNECRLKIKKP